MRRLVLSSVWLCSFGCGNAPAPAPAPTSQEPPVAAGNPAEPEATPAKPTPTGTVAQGEVAPEPAKVERMQGTLHFRELPRTKSVAAYDGVEFFLEIDGEERKLAPSEALSREALLAFDGKRVEIEAKWRPPESPKGQGAHPVDADGSARPRAGRWMVTAATEVTP